MPNSKVVLECTLPFNVTMKNNRTVGDVCLWPPECVTQPAAGRVRSPSGADLQIEPGDGSHATITGWEPRFRGRAHTAVHRCPKYMSPRRYAVGQGIRWPRVIS